MSAPDPNSPTSVTVDQMVSMINTLITTTNNMVVAVNSASQQQQSQYITLAQQQAETNKNLIETNKNLVNIDKTVGMGFQGMHLRIVPLEDATTKHATRIEKIEEYKIKAEATIKAHKIWLGGIFSLCAGSILANVFFIYDARTKLPQLEKQVEEIRENMRHDYSERKGKNETR